MTYGKTRVKATAEKGWLRARAMARARATVRA
jgi:hypothetical protein